MAISQGKVLLLDSDPSCSLFFQNIIKVFFPGKQLLTLLPGKDSYATCLSEHPDIIIIETFTTGAHGLRLIKDIKSAESLHNIPLIALTEKNNECLTQPKVFEVGADLCISKPLNEAATLAALKMCFRLSALERTVPQEKKTMINQLEATKVELENLRNYRSQTEEALSIERDFATQVLNAMGQGLTISNSSGYFQFANPAFCRMVGYDMQEVLGKTPYDFTIRKDHNILTAARKIRNTGQVNSYETVLTHKNGHTIDVFITGVPYYRAGNIEGSIAVITETTLLKNTETKLKKLSDEYEQIFNGTQDALFLIQVLDDNTFRFIRNNRSHQEKTGFPLNLFSGKTPEELLGEQAGALISANYARCVEAGTTITYKEEIIIDKEITWWQTSLTPIFENGTVTHIVGSSIEVTYMKDHSIHHRL